MYDQHVTCQAKATTPFGVLAGRSRVTVTDIGEDGAAIEFHCGPTPVMIVMAGKNLHNFIHLLAETCNELHRQRLLNELPPDLRDEQVAS